MFTAKVPISNMYFENLMVRSCAIAAIPWICLLVFVCRLLFHYISISVCVCVLRIFIYHMNVALTIILLTYLCVPVAEEKLCVAENLERTFDGRYKTFS